MLSNLICKRVRGNISTFGDINLFSDTQAANIFWTYAQNNAVFDLSKTGNKIPTDITGIYYGGGYTVPKYKSKYNLGPMTFTGYLDNVGTYSISNDIVSVGYTHSDYKDGATFFFNESFENQVSDVLDFRVMWDGYDYEYLLNGLFVPYLQVHNLLEKNTINSSEIGKAFFSEAYDSQMGKTRPCIKIPIAIERMHFITSCIYGCYLKFRKIVRYF